MYYMISACVISVLRFGVQLSILCAVWGRISAMVIEMQRKVLNALTIRAKKLAGIRN